MMCALDVMNTKELILTSHFLSRDGTFKKCDCSGSWSASHFSNQFWWTVRALKNFVKSIAFLVGIHLTSLSLVLLTSKKYVFNKVELSLSELLLSFNS